MQVDLRDFSEAKSSSCGVGRPGKDFKDSRSSLCFAVKNGSKEGSPTHEKNHQANDPNIKMLRQTSKIVQEAQFELQTNFELKALYKENIGRSLLVRWQDPV